MHHFPNTKMDENTSMSPLYSMLVLLMLIGLQMIEAGSVRSKNVSSVFLRGIATLTISIGCSWICGFMFCFSKGHYLLGYDSDYLALTKVETQEYGSWLMYTVVCSLSSIIVASSMSERTHITGHLILTMFVSIIIFPTSAHWVWQQGGWLTLQGCTDIGGVMVVHMFSGCGALVGSLLVGPRVERLGDNFRDVALPGHSLPLTAVGAMLVIIGMVGKIAGLGVSEDPGHVTANTLVGGAAGGLITMNLFKIKTRRGKKYTIGNNNLDKSTTVANRKWSFLAAFNGFFTGTICVCGVGSELPTWGAFIAGIVGGMVFFLLSGLLRINKIDDPVHGIGVHLSGGLVGTIVVGLSNLVKTTNGLKIGWQIVGLISISAWACGCFLAILLPLLICGKLRIKDCQEKAGIDKVKIKEQAYEFSTPASFETARMSSLDEYLTPTGGNRRSSMSCQLSAINKKSNLHCSRCSGLDVDEVSPRTVIARPSTGGSVETLCIPPPPPYPTSTMRTVNNSLAVPEVTITSSCISENDSEAPLLNSMTNSDASSQATTSLRTRDLKMNLRKQKEMLRKTGSKFQCSEAEIDANSSLDSNESFRSVNRHVETVASNKDNFNYLTPTGGTRKNNFEMLGNVTNDEVNETEIDITKYLKSPLQEDDVDKLSPKVKVVEVDTDSGKKMFETSIEFTSEESDFDENFDEKLI